MLLLLFLFSTKFLHPVVESGATAVKDFVCDVFSEHFFLAGCVSACPLGSFLAWYRREGEGERGRVLAQLSVLVNVCVHVHLIVLSPANSWVDFVLALLGLMDY